MLPWRKSLFLNAWKGMKNNFRWITYLRENSFIVFFFSLSFMNIKKLNIDLKTKWKVSHSFHNRKVKENEKYSSL